MSERDGASRRSGARSRAVVIARRLLPLAPLLSAFEPLEQRNREVEDGNAR